ncbi:MAG: DUF4114 domain-containing protein [Opitutaceae bacterium]|nr:DUF4114 domain-containing protein [Opitutaceae bacterium]
MINIRSTLRLFTLVAASVFLAAAAHAVPILGGNIVVTADSEVHVTFEGYSAGYTSQLFLQNPGNDLGMLFVNKTTAVGSTIALGTFAAGTELIFRLFVVPTGQNFLTGDALRNSDNIAHAYIETIGNKTFVGFEDIWGGGDRDYNDYMFSVTANPVPDSAATGALLVLGLGALALARRRLA